MVSSGRAQKMRRDESGFTLVEMLTAIAIFAAVSVSFYQVMFSVVRGSDDAQSVANVSEEARMGFNRMVRDTREGQEITAASPTSFTVRVDYENDTLGPQMLTFSKSGSALLLNGEVLMRGVDCLRQTDGGPCSQDVFTYSSNQLEYDWNRDGVTTWQELDDSADPSRGVVGVGNNDDILNQELSLVSNVTIAMTVDSGRASGRLIAEAQLRNRR